MEDRKKIGLICDEGGDLPREIIERHQISIVPFKIDLGEIKNLSGNVYQRIREAEKNGIKSFVKTSQPSPGDFLVAFEETFWKFKEIICITITSKHSGTYNSAIQARNFLEENLKSKVEIIDSLSGSGGEGLLVLSAVSLIEKELNFEETLGHLKKFISKTHVIFTFKDPKWIEASGRISHFLATWLRGMQKIGIRPILGAERGEIKPVSIRRGTKDIATPLFKEFKSRISSKFKNGDVIIKVAITHADNVEEAIKLKEMIGKIKNTKIVFINLMGNIIGGLAGPGTLALAWQEP